MKKCGFWKKALVYLSVMAMTPQSIIALGAELTAEALEPDADVLVRWIPDEDEIKTGEEGNITLEAELNVGRGAVGAAQVFVSLTRQEAEAMLQFQDYFGKDSENEEDGDKIEAAFSSRAEYIEEEEEIFPGYLEDEEEDREDGEDPKEEYFFEDKGEPFLTSDKGDIPIRIVEDEEEVRLVFVLDEENSYLRQEFRFSLPAGTRELFDIDVTEDDISVVTAVPLPEEEEPDKKKDKPKKDKPKTDPAAPAPGINGGGSGSAGGTGTGGSGEAVPGGENGENAEGGSAGTDVPEDFHEEEAPGTDESGSEDVPEEGEGAPSDGEENGAFDDGEEGENKQKGVEDASGDSSDEGNAEKENSDGEGENSSADSGDIGTSDKGDGAGGGSDSEGGNSAAGGSDSGSGDSAGSEDSAGSGSDSDGGTEVSSAVGRSVKSWPRVAAAPAFRKATSMLRMTSQDSIFDNEPVEEIGEEPEKEQEESEEETEKEDGQDEGAGEEPDEELGDDSGKGPTGGTGENFDEDTQKDPEEEPEEDKGQKPGDGSGEEPDESQSGESGENPASDGADSGEAAGEETLEGEVSDEENDTISLGEDSEDEEKGGINASETDREIDGIATPSQPEDVEAVPAPIVDIATVSTATASTATSSQVRYDGDAVIEIDARPMVFIAEFGWEMEMEPVETQARSAGETADGQEEAVFRLRAVSQNREETGVLHTAKQSFRFELILPPELALPEGTVAYDGTANALRAGGTEIAVLEGMPEDARITEIEKADAQNLSFTLLREQDELEEEMADMDLTVRVVRDGLTLTEVFTGEAQPAAEENAAAVQSAPEEAAQQAVPRETENLAVEPVAEISRARLSVMPLLGKARDGEKGEEGNVTLEELFASEPRIKEVEIRLTVTAAAVPGAGEEYQAEQSREAAARIILTYLPDGVVAVKNRDTVEQKYFWIDNENEAGVRPKQYPGYKIQFRLKQTDANGNLLEGDEAASTDWVDLTEENRQRLGINSPPGATAINDDTDSPTLIVGEEIEGDHLMPSWISYTTDPEMEEETTSYYQVEWQLVPSDPPGEFGENYALVQIAQEEIESGIYGNITEPGWYYVLLTDFSFDLTLRWGELESAEGIVNAVLESLELQVFYDGTYDGKYPLNEIPGTNITITKDPGSNPDDPENPTSGTITISGLWKYRLDGTEIMAWVTDMDANREIEIDALDEGDYFAISYDNSSAPNFGAETERLHDGGTIYLTLSGSTGYTATKTWLDTGDKGKRPGGEFQLWRYRDGSSYTTAAPVRNRDNQIITIPLSKNQDSYTISDPQLEDLPKYDNEGYRYVYVLREYLDAGEGTAQYEQVLGSISEDGTITDTVWDSENNATTSDGKRESGDTYLYNRGTLSNRITDTVRVEADKKWEALAFQSELDDVRIELTLQSRSAGPDAPWEDVYDENGKTITAELEDFYAETMNSRTAAVTVNRYDERGRALEYRWVETGVFQGESTDNLLKGDTFKLIQNGRSMIYRADSSEPDTVGTASSSYVNHITNSLENELSYTVDKYWVENGDRVKPEAGEKEPVTFSIYQIHSGTDVTENLKPYLEFTLDGTKDEDWKEIGRDGIRWKEDAPWHAEVEGLPEFDGEGREYEYLLLEQGGNPTYEITRDSEQNYITTVLNGEGPGTTIMVRKQWIDDNDVQHRLPVKIQVYTADGQEIGEPVTLGEAGVWQQLVGIGENDPSEVYVRELSVEGDESSYNIKKISENSDIWIVETDNHRYQVTYPEAVNLEGTYFHTIVNRRLGHINMTVTKEWDDGAGERRTALQEALKKLKEGYGVTLYPAIRLQFTEAHAGAGYEITQFNKNGDAIQIGGEGSEWVPIYTFAESNNPEVDEADTVASSVQELLLTDLKEDKQALYFYNLPKYDASGQIVHYEVKEVWVLEKNGKKKTVTLEGLQAVYPPVEEIRQLLNPYTTLYGAPEYEVSELHDTDNQSITVRNTLSGKKDVLWHKQWEDSYNNDSNLRPDLYLDIYRVSQKPGAEAEVYKKDYRWVNADALYIEGEEGNLYDDDHHWHVLLEDVDKYDPEGYEYIYYAVERTAVNAESFGYQPAVYSVPKIVSGGIPAPGEDAGLDVSLDGVQQVGTVNGPDETHENDASGWMYDVTEEGDAESTWALAENGTFTNRIQGTVSITGRKIWSGLPSGYERVNLPPVAFALNRYVKRDKLHEEAEEGKSDQVWDTDENGKRKEIAVLTIEKWDALYANGSYAFTIAYEGQNVMRVNDDGSVEFDAENPEEQKLLPRYDEQGRLYHYVLKETGIGEGTAWKGNFQDGAIYDPMDSDGTETYIVNNRYKQNQGAHLTIKKFLYLPGETGADGRFDPSSGYPAVQFRLYRRFTKNDGNPSEWELVDTGNQLIWDSDDVRDKFDSAENDSSAKTEGLLEWTGTVDALAVYAPNGSKYEYMAAELRNNLQGYNTWVTEEDMTQKQAEEFIKNTENPPVNPEVFPEGSSQRVVTTSKETGKTLSPATASNAEKGTPSQATFVNKIHTNDTVIITGTKVWDDFNNVFGLRPATDSNAGDDVEKELEEHGFTFTLQRYALPQPDQENGIGSYASPQIVDRSRYTIVWKTNESGQWTYTIEGTEENPLERYAPNGMEWIYLMQENSTNEEYRVEPQGGKVISERTETEEAVTKITMRDLTNTLQVPDKPYAKVWQDDKGKPITEDYLGYQLRVTFELQVAERGADGKITSSEWEPAETYFKEALRENFDDIFKNDYRFTRTLPESGMASVTDETVWNRVFYFEDLPRRIKKNGNDTTTHLTYRVVEKQIAYGTGEGSVRVGVNEHANSNLKNYTYTFDPNSLFSPGYASGGENTYTTVRHVNRIRTTDFTVTKSWEGDNENIYGTRPSTEGGNGWKTSFVVQRKTEETDWTDVRNADGELLIIDVIGTGESASLPVSGLPAADASGNAYVYRAQELEPGYVTETKNGQESISGKYRIEDSDGYYKNAYTASYSNAGQGGLAAKTATPSTVVTNRLKTTKVYAEKRWRGTGQETTPVTLELQYLATPSDAQRPAETDWKSFETPAKITLKGTSNPQNTQVPYYEYDKWKAVWEEVPEYMPGSYRGEGGTAPTQYRVVETLGNTGFIKVDYELATKSDATPPETGPEYPNHIFTNTAVTSLTVEKVWGAPNNFNKKAVIAEVWRTTDSIGNAEVPDISTDSNAERVSKNDPIESTEKPDDQYVVMLNSANGWKRKIENLPKYGEDNKPYYYFALERSVGDYFVTNNSDNDISSIALDSGILAIHHTHQNGASGFASKILNIASTDVAVKKIWKDNNDEYGTRPDSLTLMLYRHEDPTPDYELNESWEKVTDESGKPVQPERTTVNTTLSEWEYVYENLPYANEDGTKYTYQVVEECPAIASPFQAGEAEYVPNYSTDHLTITNRLNGTTELTVTKNWEDGGDADRWRPGTITLTLYQRLANSSDEWVKYNAEGIANPIEIDSGDLAARLMNFLTRNTDQWEYTFRNLAKFNDAGEMYEYKVEETVPDGYYSETITNGDAAVTITNTLLTRVPVEKIWGDVPSDDQKEVSVGLYRSVNENTPEPVTNKDIVGYSGEDPEKPLTLILNTGNWSGTFTNLPRFTADGDRITYTVRELSIGGIPVESLTEDERYIIHYTAEKQEKDEQPAYTISNIRRTNLTGTKTWRDDGDADGRRPADLTLHLRRSTDSNALASLTDGDYSEASPSNASWQEVTPDMLASDGGKLTWDKTQGDTWSYIYESLPATDDGGYTYYYYVTETVPDGYVLQTASPSQVIPGNAERGTDFTNLRTNESLTVTGTKTWEDSGANRSDSLTIFLYRQAEGQQTDGPLSVEPVWSNTDTDTWTFTYSGLPEFDLQGRRYTYWVEEENVTGYDGYHGENGLELVNVEQGSLTVAKNVTGSRGDRTCRFTFTVTMQDTVVNGVTLRAADIDGTYGGMTFADGTATFTLADGESVTASGLPGGMAYTVTEVEADENGYHTSAEGSQGTIPAGGTAQALFVNYRGSSGSSGGGGGSNGGGGGGHRYVDTSGGGPGAGGGGSTAVVVGEQPNLDIPEVPLIRRIVAKTGDESKILQYAILFFVSLVGLAALLFLGPLKKWRKKK